MLTADFNYDEVKSTIRKKCWIISNFKLKLIFRLNFIYQATFHVQMPNNEGVRIE